MDNRVILAGLIFSAIVMIGWKWMRSRNKDVYSPDKSIPPTQAKSSLTPDGMALPDRDEVRAKPQFNSTTTQHLQHDGIDVYFIPSLSECDTILSGIPRENLSLCGFDCEWSQSYHLDEIAQEEEGGTSTFIYPVALVQIATMDSRCYLIQLSSMENQIPQSLVSVLEDERCLKFGVNVLNDLNRLKTHYFIHPRGGVDLRHLARDKIEGERMGLQALSRHFLGINLNKDPQLQRSNWQCRNLSLEQLIYAAMDAKVSLNILLSIVQHISKESPTPQPIHCYGLGAPSTESVEFISDICTPFIDAAFTGGSRANRKPRERRANNPDLVSEEALNKPAPYVTRKRVLYENCRLLAPDNELLSLIDRRKANWYFERELAELVSEEPYVVRLKFEPKSRPEKGNVDKSYYQADKLNICVVCGEQDGNGIRKKIVPSEYRKYFPVDHKSYKSHDNLLLCGRCHLKTSLYEDILKDHIAKEFDSPIDSGASKLLSDPILFQVKNAARALAQSTNKLPAEKATQYVELVKNYYQVEGLDEDLIRKAANIDPKKENPAYKPHGQKVVEQVLANGELLQFQMRWREHFLSTMKPQFLPEMWSTTHNPNKFQYF